MVDTFKKRIRGFFFRGYIQEIEKREKNLESTINQRVAETLSKMDPFEPLLKEFHGAFNREFERVEDNLDERSRINMAMWAYAQYRDPFFIRMIEWVMNGAGNETLKRAAPTEIRLMYGRAQISTMVLLRDEIKRLSGVYEEIIEKNKPKSFQSELAIE